MASITSYVSSPQISLQELQNGQQQQQQQQQISNPPVLQNGQQQQQQQQQQIPNPPVDDFLEQMLSNLPWNEISGASKSPWELNPYTLNPNNNNNNNGNNNNQKIFTISLTPPNKSRDFSEDSSPENAQYGYDDSSLLASRLRQHQISSPHNQNSTVVSGNHSPGKSKVLQLNTANVGLHSSQRLVSRGMARSPATSAASCISDNCLLPLPLTLGQGNPDSSDSRLMVDRSREELEASFKSNNRAGETRIQGLYNGFSGSQPRNAQTCNQHFHAQPGSVPTQNYGAPADGKNQPTANGPAGGHIPVRQRVRARRGQATDPHSIAERLRRERIAERMKALQELVPNANKTDKASMLDEIIDYVKFLQLQVKVLSMSRLGGAAAIAPLVADVSSEGGDCIQASGIGRSSNGTQPPSQDSLTVTEHQVAKLMEEDMGSAMQYLQGKGLCLMPISLASAISTATCHSRNHNILLASNVDGPPSPSISVLTVQSAMGNGTDTDVSRSSLKDATSVSKP